MSFFKDFFIKNAEKSLKKELKNILGFAPDNFSLYITALTHRSVSENVDENNERLEYLGDAILSAVTADYLFRRYPYHGEGFLTEMRSKMVNRQQLNDVAVRMGLKKSLNLIKRIIALKQAIFLAIPWKALVGAIYLDYGYKRTCRWVQVTLSRHTCLWMSSKHADQSQKQIIWLG